MKTILDSYICHGYDLVIGMIDRGPNEGWFKACLENGEITIEEVGETPGEALKKLRMKLTPLVEMS